jgi:hypothetical protein
MSTPVPLIVSMRIKQRAYKGQRHDARARHGSQVNNEKEKNPANHAAKRMTREEYEHSRDFMVVLSDEGNAEFRLMSRFVSETANVLQLVQATLRSHSFDEFVNHVFD